MLEGRWWLAENLDYGKFIKYGEKEQEDNGIIEKYCYNNDSLNCIKNGGIYYWDEATGYLNEQRVQGVCPPGWHIPDYYEWFTVIKDYKHLFFIWYLGQGGLSSFNLSYNLEEYYMFPDFTFFTPDAYCVSGRYDVVRDNTLEKNLYYRLNSNNNLSNYKISAYHSKIRCIKDE